MKTTIKLIAISAFLFTSCSKDIEMCIDGNMNPDKPGTYTYTWCGENADRILWSTNKGDFLGESVSLTFSYEGIQQVSVTAENKRKDEFKQYEIKVGTYGARVELGDCNGSIPLVDGYIGENYRAYLYPSLSELQNDFRNNNFSSSIDSITLEASNYYNFDVHSSTSLVGEFKGSYASGEYLVYVREFNKPGSDFKGCNNLDALMLYGSSFSTINIQNGELDDLLVLRISPNSESAQINFIKNLVSKNYLLTDVIIDGTSTGVPVCNADDNIVFNIDGTFTYNVGANDCDGAQTTSEGSFSGFTGCNYYPTGTTFPLEATSGSMLGTTYYLNYMSETKIRLTAIIGVVTLIQEFTIE